MPKPLGVLEPVLPPAEREQPSPLHKENWPAGLVPASGKLPSQPPPTEAVEGRRGGGLRVKPNPTNRGHSGCL